MLIFLIGKGQRSRDSYRVIVGLLTDYDVGNILVVVVVVVVVSSLGEYARVIHHCAGREVTQCG